MNEIRNVVIIGSGPSGYTAALYTARAGLHPLLIAGSFDPSTSRMKGGQLMQTSDIENFPAAIQWPVAEGGEVHGISGRELMHRMEIQAVASGTELLEEFVTEVDLCQNPGRIYTVKTAGGHEIKTRAVIIATGARARKLGIPAEEKFFGQGGGVSTCATCDGAQFARAGAVIAVIGGGDSAMEEASYLARLDGIPKVYLIHRREEFRASKVMLKRTQENPKIEMILNATVEDLKGKPHPLSETMPYYKDKELLAAAVLKDTKTGETRELPINGLFVAVGHTPNTDLFHGQLKMDEAGYLEHDKHMRGIPSTLCSSAEMRSLEHVPGVFVAGDVADHVYRQAITAAGMGCQAAIEAERYLAEAMVAETGVNPGDVDISVEGVAESHWGPRREADPLIMRVEEAAAV